MGRNLESVDFFSVNNPCYGREWVRGVMRQDNYAAVFFCEQGKIVREMLYAEFEAILDSFVPMPEYAGQDIKAIYVEIGPSIKVVAAVYFTILTGDFGSPVGTRYTPGPHKSFHTRCMDTI